MKILMATQYEFVQNVIATSNIIGWHQTYQVPYSHYFYADTKFSVFPSPGKACARAPSGGIIANSKNEKK